MKISLLLTAHLFVLCFCTSVFAQQDSSIVQQDLMKSLLSQEIYLPVDLTAEDVINKYLEAIGGRELFASIKDRTTIMLGTAMDQEINIVVKQKEPNLFRQEIQAGAMKQELIFNGEKAVMIIGDETINVEGKELERLKTDATLHLLLDPARYNLKLELEGIELIDSIYCYKINMILPSGIRWFQFYSIESRLKIKEQKEIQTPQGLFEQDIYYYDYRDVDGLKFPFSIIQSFGMQQMELTISSIKINNGIKTDIFKIPE